MNETHANENYTGILEATCINEHSFADIYEKILTKFFNVMCKNFVSEVNSATHKAKKRKTSTKEASGISSSCIKIRKLQSEKWMIIF